MGSMHTASLSKFISHHSEIPFSLFSLPGVFMEPVSPSQEFRLPLSIEWNFIRRDVEKWNTNVGFYLPCLPIEGVVGSGMYPLGLKRGFCP